MKLTPRHFAMAALALAACTAETTIGSTSAQAAPLPEIRTSSTNRVPSCVTPHGLMRFLRSVNPDLDPKLDRIADHYRQHGTALGVRWDYAFFQMALETNYLRFRRASGRPGDARRTQNNFAGLGTTGGGVPGETFRDVGTGVRAQLEHLVAYSGERVAAPVAKRTADNQDDIIKRMRRIGRSIRFSDLQMRWAIDRGYARKIASIAERFEKGGFCDGRAGPVEAAIPKPTIVHVGRMAARGR